MVLLYAKKVTEILICSDETEVEGSLSYLKSKEKVKEAEHAKMVEWLSARIGKQNIKLIIE